MRIGLPQFVLILSLSTAAPALAGAPPADGELRLDRYTLKKQSARPEQIDLLSAVIETRFPDSIATAGDAIGYMLLRSGYRFIHTEESSAAMALELPAVHRSLGPMPLRDAIRTIAGTAWQLRENSEERTVWLERNRVAGADAPSPSSPAADSRREAGPASAAPAQRAGTPAPAAVASTWLLDPEKTLSANLDAWAGQAGWSMQWSSLHDYEIDYPATFEGTFMQAVEWALEHYRAAPVPLTADFYVQNQVLLIQAASAVR